MLPLSSPTFPSAPAATVPEVISPFSTLVVCMGCSPIIIPFVVTVCVSVTVLTCGQGITVARVIVTALVVMNVLKPTILSSIEVIISPPTPPSIICMKASPPLTLPPPFVMSTGTSLPISCPLPTLTTGHTYTTGTSLPSLAPKVHEIVLPLLSMSPGQVKSLYGYLWLNSFHLNHIPAYQVAGPVQPVGAVHTNQLVPDHSLHSLVEIVHHPLVGHLVPLGEDLAVLDTQLLQLLCLIVSTQQSYSGRPTDLLLLLPAGVGQVHHQPQLGHVLHQLIQVPSVNTWPNLL